MNNLKGLFKRQQPSLVILGSVIIFTLLIGLFFSGTVLISTIINEELYKQPFCFKNGCVSDFIKDTETVFTSAKATFDLGVAIATIGGIFVALLSYLSSSANSALTNHIEHLKIFSDYLDGEIKKRDRLSHPLIDTLFLYSFIFRQSRSGKTEVSSEYEKFISDLNKIIDESNQRCVVGTPGGFSYKNHQRRIRDHLHSIGITVNTAPRNDYFEMEAQLFSLINRISQSFCSSSNLAPIAKQTYY